MTSKIVGFLVLLPLIVKAAEKPETCVEKMEGAHKCIKDMVHSLKPPEVLMEDVAVETILSETKTCFTGNGCVQDIEIKLPKHKKKKKKPGKDDYGMGKGGKSDDYLKEIFKGPSASGLFSSMPMAFGGISESTMRLAKYCMVDAVEKIMKPKIVDCMQEELPGWEFPKMHGDGEDEEEYSRRKRQVGRPRKAPVMVTMGMRAKFLHMLALMAYDPELCPTLQTDQIKTCLKDMGPSLYPSRDTSSPVDRVFAMVEKGIQFCSAKYACFADIEPECKRKMHRVPKMVCDCSHSVKYAAEPTVKNHVENCMISKSGTGVSRFMARVSILKLNSNLPTPYCSLHSRMDDVKKRLKDAVKDEGELKKVVMKKCDIDEDVSKMGH